MVAQRAYGKADFYTSATQQDVLEALAAENRWSPRGQPVVHHIRLGCDTYCPLKYWPNTGEAAWAVRRTPTSLPDLDLGDQEQQPQADRRLVLSITPTENYSAMKIHIGLLAIAAAAFTSCCRSGTVRTTRAGGAHLDFAAAIGFDADGRTTDWRSAHRDGEPLRQMYGDWYAELVGTDWAASLPYGSPDGAVERLRITCSANTDYKRSMGTLRVTLSKTGESVDFRSRRLGSTDATLTLSTESDIE